MALPIPIHNIPNTKRMAMATFPATITSSISRCMICGTNISSRIPITKNVMLTTYKYQYFKIACLVTYSLFKTFLLSLLPQLSYINFPQE